jgi:hypothetical protein
MQNVFHTLQIILKQYKTGNWPNLSKGWGGGGGKTLNFLFKASLVCCKIQAMSSNKYGIGWQIPSNHALYIWVALSLTVWYVIPYPVNCVGKRAFWWLLFANGHCDKFENILPTLGFEWMFWSIISYFLFNFYFPSECANYKDPGQTFVVPYFLQAKIAQCVYFARHS